MSDSSLSVLLCQVSNGSHCSLGLCWCYAEALESVFVFGVQLCKYTNYNSRFLFTF